jgi:hypothetical protein
MLGLALVAVHLWLVAWAAVGLVEWLFPQVGPLFTNPLFPRWLQLVHWIAVLAGAGTFLAGYWLRWRTTPMAVAIAYIPMAAVCAIETFGYLTHDARFIAMAAEYAAYVTIPLVLAYYPPLASRFRSALA